MSEPIRVPAPSTPRPRPAPSPRRRPPTPPPDLSLISGHRLELYTRPDPRVVSQVALLWRARLWTNAWPEGRPSPYGRMRVITTDQFAGRRYLCRCGWVGWSVWGHARRHATRCPEAGRA